MTERGKMLKSAMDGGEGDWPEMPETRPPCIVLQADPEDVVYVVATDLVCMTRNAAEAYVVARAMADACRRFPADADYTADEVRRIVDSVSKRVRVKNVCGRVDETDVLRLLDRGIALLNTVWLAYPCSICLRFVAEVVSNLFERGLDKSRYEDAPHGIILRALTESLVVYIKKMGMCAETMHEHERMDGGRPAMRGQDLRKKERLDSQHNIMYL